jgi:PAS domain S-box-containing protein
MSSVKLTKRSTTVTDVIFAIMLMAIFTSELVVTALFSPLFSRLGLFYASLLDAGILALLFALPNWFFVIKPISAMNRLQWKKVRGLPQLLFLALQTGIFLSEFLVMMALHLMIPQADTQTIALADACLTTLCSAPLLWWVMYGKELQGEQIHTDDIVTDPSRLFGLLVLMVFLADLLMDIFTPFLSQYLSPAIYLLVDASLSTLFIASLLWGLLILPLKRRSLSQRAVLNAVYIQAVDAFVSIDAEGTILSFNPAAERIFGYDADGLIGMKGALLFARGQQELDEIIAATAQSGKIAGVSHEATGIRRDGSLLTVDVSISRILLDNRLKLLIIMRDISERKAMEKAIQASEERLSFAVNGSNDGIWDWDVQSGEVYYCPRFKDLLGYRVDEMEHTFAAFESRLHPDDHDRVIEAVRLHLEENLPYDVQYRLRTSSGAYHWYRARGQAVRDQAGKPLRMAGSISDINTQKKALEALRESEVRFRQIFEQSEDAIIFFKPGSCVIIDINTTAEKLFGYAKTELQNAGLELVTGPADLPLLINAISNISPERGKFLERVGCVCRDGREIIVSMRGKVMTLQNVNIVYCTFRDVTERLHMEQEAREIQAKLIQINKMTSLGLMVSGVAHEINNPNNFIMANSQLLKRSWLDALTILREYYRENGEFFIGGVPFSELETRSPELFDGILEGSNRINGIIDNLKKFARNEQSLDNSTLDVNQVATSAIAILHFELNKFTKKFHVELTESIPRVKGSGQQLGQIIINLLMNACQALPDSEHGIWLTTGMNAGADQVILSVRDEGQGMSPERSKMIMEPFFTTKLDSGGTGLGLSICRSIAREHSWSIDFTSEQGKGSTFTVRIPVEVHSDEEPSA